MYISVYVYYVIRSSVLRAPQCIKDAFECVDSTCFAVHNELKNNARISLKSDCTLARTNVSAEHWDSHSVFVTTVTHSEVSEIRDSRR